MVHSLVTMSSPESARRSGDFAQTKNDGAVRHPRSGKNQIAIRVEFVDGCNAFPLEAKFMARQQHSGLNFAVVIVVRHLNCKWEEKVPFPTIKRSRHGNRFCTRNRKSQLRCTVDN